MFRVSNISTSCLATSDHKRPKKVGKLKQLFTNNWKPSVAFPPRKGSDIGAKVWTWGQTRAPNSQPRITAKPQFFFPFTDSHLCHLPAGPPSYHQSVWFEQQAVTQVRRGSCLCSSCGRPLCGGCGLTCGSCWPPFCVGPGMSPGFVLGLWVGPLRY